MKSRCSKCLFATNQSFPDVQRADSTVGNSDKDSRTRKLAPTAVIRLPVKDRKLGSNPGTEDAKRFAPSKRIARRLILAVRFSHCYRRKEVEKGNSLTVLQRIGKTLLEKKKDKKTI